MNKFVVLVVEDDKLILNLDPESDDYNSRYSQL